MTELISPQFEIIKISALYLRNIPGSVGKSGCECVLREDVLITMSFGWIRDGPVQYPRMFAGPSTKPPAAKKDDETLLDVERVE